MSDPRTSREGRAAPTDSTLTDDTRAGGAPVIGVDVGGTGIKALLLDPADHIRRERRRPTPRPGPHIAERVADAVHEVVAQLSAHCEPPPQAVGVAVPGLVDEDAGLAVFSENLGWHDAPIRDMVAERTGLSVALAHDVRIGALAEARLGAGRNHQNVVFLPIGTGISAALLLDGHIHAAGGFAGEIGHTDVGHGEPCVCGSRGCLEAIASAAAIARRYTRRTGVPAPGAREVLDRAAAGDTRAQAVWDEALDALGLALAWIASVLAPDTVIIGGGLSQAGHRLFEPLTHRLEARLSFQHRPLLTPAGLGDRAAALGSALLAQSTGTGTATAKTEAAAETAQPTAARL